MTTTTPLDPRTRRRRRKLALATTLAWRLNEQQKLAAKVLLDGRCDENLARIRALATQAPQKFLGVDVEADGRRVSLGYERYVITALRPYGQATLWWHARSRCFRVTVRRNDHRGWDRRGKSTNKLLLDDFAKVSGLVARCASWSCGEFYARQDGRQRFCSTRCADRERQRGRRKRANPAARAAFEEAERQRSERERERAGRAALVAFYDAKRDVAADASARRAQHYFRHRARQRDPE